MKILTKIIATSHHNFTVDPSCKSIGDSLILSIEKSEHMQSFTMCI